MHRLSYARRSQIVDARIRARARKHVERHALRHGSLKVCTPKCVHGTESNGAIEKARFTNTILLGVSI